jgi:hypothetical protein
METSLKTFPITGGSCSVVLSAAVNPEKTWILTSIETLSDVPARELGDLWRQVQTGPVTLTTVDLCAALDLASQVVTLDVKLVENLAVELLIEDGVTVECHLL